MQKKHLCLAVMVTAIWGLSFPITKQFAYASCGVITVFTDRGNWVVPPQRAIWVPARLGHAMHMCGPVTMLNTYIREPAALALGLPEACQVYGVSALLRQLLDKAIEVPALYSAEGRDGHLMGLLLHEIAAMPALSLNAPLPKSRGWRSHAGGNSAWLQQLKCLCDCFQAGAGRGAEPLYGGIGRRQERRLARRSHRCRKAAARQSLHQCSLSRGSVPRPILLPIISIAVRNAPYSAIWCMRYSDT